MMMKKSLMLLVVFALFMGSCKKKDEECVAPAFDKNLVGTWAVSYSGLATGGPVSAVFKADGTMEGEFTALASQLAMKPLTNFKWVATSTSVTVSGTDAAGATTSIPLTMKENVCNKIVLDYLSSITIEMKK